MDGESRAGPQPHESRIPQGRSTPCRMVARGDVPPLHPLLAVTVEAGFRPQYASARGGRSRRAGSILPDSLPWPASTVPVKSGVCETVTRTLVWLRAA